MPRARNTSKRSLAILYSRSSIAVTPPSYTPPLAVQAPPPSTPPTQPTQPTQGMENAGNNTEVGTTDKFVRAGRRTVRFEKLFTTARTLLDNHVEVAADPTVLQNASKKDLFDTLQAIFKDDLPALDLILTAPPEVFDSIERRMREGMLQAKHADTHLVSSSNGRMLSYFVPSNQPGEPPLPRSKTGRGWRHSITSAMLCPAEMYPITPAVRADLEEGLAQLPDRARVPDGRDFPIGFYRGCQYNPKRKLDNLLTSMPLIRVGRCIATCPASGTINDFDPERDAMPGLALEVPRESRGARQGNAQLAGVHAVTPAFIGYVCAQVWFSWSNKVVFRRGMTREIGQIYDSVLALLTNEHPIAKNFANRVLAYWNFKLFPDAPAQQEGPGNIMEGSLGDILADLDNWDSDAGETELGN